MIEPLLSDDAFLADVESVPADDRVHLWWLGQSGYLVRWRDERILIDPYLSDSLTVKYANTAKPHVRMSRRVVDPAKLRGITLVTSSHGHTDHLDAATLKAVRLANPKAKLIAPRAIRSLVEERWGGPADHLLTAGEAVSVGGVEVVAVPASHPEFDCDDDEDHPYLGYVLRFKDVSIYHAGDTVVFPGLAGWVRHLKPTVAILPINGKVGNMSGVDAAKLGSEVGAMTVIPCHYDLFEFNTADPTVEFIPECRALYQGSRVLRLGERLTLG